MPAPDDVLRAWARHHDGYDPSRSRLVRGWVRGMHVLAQPLSRRGVHPDAVTAVGVACAGLATLAPRRSAAALVVGTAVCDGLDGAVARRRGVASARGTVVDHVADRVTDLLFVAALRHAGAARRTTTAAASTLAFECVRDLLRVAGRPVDIATVGERPARVAVVAAGLLTSPAAATRALATLSLTASVQLVWRLGAPSRRTAGDCP